MNRAYRDILKHSAVYGLGQILTRLASFLLLPLYTSYLRPADYGCIAILDLTATVLGILIGSGIAVAVNRYHFEVEQERDRDRVWWTGLTFVAVVATAVVLPLWVSRDALARLTLGPAVVDGGRYFALVLPTLWFSAVGQLPDGHLRVRKWSGLSVGLAMTVLLVNIALNVFFLVVMELGIDGVLWGNLIAGLVGVTARLATFVRSRGPYAFQWQLAKKLWAFGGPLIVTSLLQLLMHQADRYFLRIYLDLDEVGIYSLGYMIGQAAYMMCVIPFGSIWNVAVYEIAQQPDAWRVYGRVFECFTVGLMLILLGVSLLARPVITLMAAPDYVSAVDVVPVVCLAYLLFSITTFFTIPALLAKRTGSLVPGNVVGATVNVVGNLALIPVFGMMGAAWASVLTFGALAATTLAVCRRIDRIELPIRRIAAIGTSFIAVFMVFEWLHARGLSGWALYPLGVLFCAAAGAVIFGPLLWKVIVTLRRPARESATPRHVQD
ncbi:MAG: polysaccharide biosynthesis protein [Pirellulales bacterium]|nr:polysaccharide biosynthesis protein [Pirellulales bacterium]